MSDERMESEYLQTSSVEIFIGESSILNNPLTST